MSSYIKKFEEAKMLEKGKNFESLRAGDIVEVYNKIIDVNLRGELKERTQIFRGTIIAIKGKGFRRSITVRKNSFGVGVEKTFLVYSPVVEDIKKITSSKVRRAKLYYLRELEGKKARLEKLQETTE